jgi:hypothetical protein
MIKLPCHEYDPLKGRVRHISSRRRARHISGSTLLSWNMAMTPALSCSHPPDA